MSAPSQDFSAAITWTQDWSAHLAANGLTITGTPTATVPTQPTGGTVTISSVTLTGSGTSVTFRASQTGLTVPTQVTIVIGVTLSNGDTDQRDFNIQFTNT